MVHQKRLFVACILALVATSFGFGARLLLLDEMGVTFNLSETQKGALASAGLFPFALSIIIFSLFLDRIGYGMGMVFAFSAHVISALLTLFAPNFEVLYFATLLFALANGAVEAVINPVTATLYPKQKTHYLNILHAGWPGGMALGMIIVILLGTSVSWQVKLAIFLIPTAVYGVMLLGQKWPVQERVAAGVSYTDMMKEFGWASCFIVSFFTILALNTVPVSLGWYADSNIVYWIALGIAAVISAIFAGKFKSFGQPLFVFLLLVMILLATTELGTDSWMGDIMKSVAGPKVGVWIPVLTAVIMFILRFFAGPIAHRITPLGLLCVCAFIAAAGLFWISQASVPPAVGIVLIGAVLYGVGKTFYWPTTLGVVCEQFPKGGAMTINSIAGVGMISVGVIGGSFLGTLQDVDKDRTLKQQDAALYERATADEQSSSFFLSYKAFDQAKIAKLPTEDQDAVKGVTKQVKQTVLGKFAILPFIMFLCYLGLIFYFKSKGGYKVVELKAAEAEAPGDAKPEDKGEPPPPAEGTNA